MTCLSEKTIILVRIYNQQLQETIILMVFDLQDSSPDVIPPHFQKIILPVIYC